MKDLRKVIIEASTAASGLDLTEPRYGCCVIEQLEKSCNRTLRCRSRGAEEARRVIQETLSVYIEAVGGQDGDSSCCNRRAKALGANSRMMQVAVGNRTFDPSVGRRPAEERFSKHIAP